MTVPKSKSGWECPKVLLHQCRQRRLESAGLLMCRVYPVAVIVGLCAGEAVAKEGMLIASANEEVVHVWRDDDAFASAKGLSRIGIPISNPEVVRNLAACTVDTNTKATTRRTTPAVTEILVVEGAESGCTGVVANKHFKVK